MRINYKQLIAYSLKTLMLVLLASMGAWQATAQSYDAITTPSGTRYPGDADDFTYSVSGFGSGTATFFLYYTQEGTNLNEDKVLGMSKESSNTFNFNWPEMSGNINLIFAAFTGDTFEGETTNITAGELEVIGATSGDDYGDGGIQMYRNGFGRYAITPSFDLSVPENVRLYVGLTDHGGLDSDNPVKVQYSTGGDTYTDLTIDALNVFSPTPTVGDSELRDFNGFGEFYFDLPEEAKASTTKFRIIQEGANSLGTNEKTWAINDMSFRIGNVYTLDAAGIGSNTVVFLETPQFEILSVLDAESNTITIASELYPGDEINLTAELLNVDLTKYNYAAVISNEDNDYTLASQTINVDNTSKIIEITGTVPTDVDYEVLPTLYAINISAYSLSASEIIIGTEDGADFTIPGKADDFIIEGGEQADPGLLFSLSGDRSLTTEPLSIPTNENGYLSFTVARANNQISPAGTDIVLEATTDGSNYTNLATVALNDLPYIFVGGTTTIELLGEEWPSSILSASTQFRVRQEANNGAGLDSWYLESITINANSNEVSENLILPDDAQPFNIIRPDVTVDDLTFTEVTYPMVDLTLNYTIEAGEFPAETGARVMLDRDSDDPDFDVILGEIEDITAGSIAFKVPLIVEGDYNLYLLTENGESYGSVTLPVYNIGVTILDVTATNPVSIAGEDYATPGSEITVNYTMTGTPGAGTELMLSVLDDANDEYVLIGATTTLDGSIAAILPTDIDYGEVPTLKLAFASGLFANTFSEQVYPYTNVLGNIPEEIFETTEGLQCAFYCDAFYGEERSATSKAYDFRQGAALNIQLLSDGDYPGDYPYAVKLQGSKDGETWEDMENFEFTSGWQSIFKNVLLPNSLWSEQTQFRLIQEDGFDEGTNVWYLQLIGIDRPEFMELTCATEPFNLIRPSLDISEYDKTAFTIGEQVDIHYNAQFFPEETEYAAVLENNGIYSVIGRSAGQGASSISATMPILPLDPDSPLDNMYDLSIVPFTPNAPSGDYEQGEALTLDLEDDILSFSGAEPYEDWMSRLTFDFYLAGERSVLTRAFDLSDAESANISFTFNEGLTGFEITDNKNTVPRFEVSTDGGNTFIPLPVYEVAEGEEQIYDDGLLYLVSSPMVDIPAEYLTESTQFRWSQPLNRGAWKDRWSVRGIELTINSGNAVPSNLYTTTENNDPSLGVTVSSPILDQYVWMQNDQDDAVFNGDTFDFLWDIDQEVEEPTLFPSGTNFTFTIDELDPETGENIIIGTSTTLGVLPGSVPTFLPNRTYNVMLTATVAVGDEEFVIHDEAWVGSLDVFLQVIKTTYLGDENVKLYAGNPASFGYEIVNDATAEDDAFYASLFYNLIIEDAAEGGDYILATQQGLAADFTVSVPAFVSAGSYTFVVKGSEGAPLGDAGTFLGLDRVENLLDNTEDNFFNFDDHLTPTWPGYRFTASSGIRELITKDMDVSDAKTIEFELDFDQEAEDLLDEETFTFEYSIDGGVTYVQLAEFPRMIDAGAVITDERAVFILPTEAITASTRFRWRQLDAKGNINLDNIKLGYVPEFPFDVLSSRVDIHQQIIQVTGFNTAAACSDATVTIDYSLKGTFTEDALVRISYRDQNDDEDDGNTGYIFPLVAGAAGTLDFDLPADFFEDYGYNNKEMTFTLRVMDDSFADVPGIDQTIYSQATAYSAATVEYISPILLDAEFSIDSQLECNPGDIKVTIDAEDRQNYFTYQFQNAATGENVGPALMYDPEVGIDFVNIGALTEPIELQMQVTSGSADGNTTCNTIISTFTDELVVNPQYVLYRSRDLIGPMAIEPLEISADNYVVSVGETETICSASTNIGLRVGRVASNSNNISFAASGVEWFRDNLATPVGSGQTLTTFALSGDYFARVTDGSCTYTTGSITINVTKAPARPEITVDSGSLLFCEGDGEAVLSAPEGFAYYLWSNGEGTRTITVDEAGSYTVQVANLPIDGAGCASLSSKAVVVEMVDSPEFYIRSSNDYGSGSSVDNIVNEGTVLSSCMSQNIYFFENISNINTGIVVLTKDGAEYASTTGSSFTITESGVYSAERRSKDLTVSCVRTIGNFTVTIDEKPTGVPALTATGNLEFCEGEGTVLLTAPPGFANYQWYKNGFAISTNTPGFSATLNTFEVTDGGTYSVSVGNASGCYGPVSNVISVTVRSLPSLPSSITQVESSCGEGAVTFSFVGSTSYRYQLINAFTGLPSGNSVPGSSGALITSDPITEATPFYFEVSYADGSGCINFDELSTITGYVNNVSLELNGNTLQAVITSFSGYEDIRWFRNGVLLKNKIGTSISITDAAEYSVEVDFNGAGICTQTSNAIDLGSAPAGRSNGRISATAYPNPSQDELSIGIEGENFGIYRVDIMSLAGQVLISHEFDKQLEEFDQKISIRHLERGLYNMHISKDGLSKNFRIVKN